LDDLDSYINSNKILILDTNDGMKEVQIINLKIKEQEEKPTYFTAISLQKTLNEYLVAFEQTSGNVYCFSYNGIY